VHDSNGTVTHGTHEGAPEAVVRVERSFTDTGRSGSPSFEEQFAAIVEFQRQQIELYRRYLELLGDQAGESPHLPIESFRRGELSTFSPDRAEAIFHSSGTTGAERSRHAVHRLGVYEKSIRTNFERQFGVGPFTFLADLPGYTDAGGTSSLLYMVRCLIRSYGDEESGSFAGRREALEGAVAWSERYGTRLILFGVAFGLLELVDARALPLPPGSVVIEPGGMKTRRQEISRDDLHRRLADGFAVDRSAVVSEYGMCELLSQCYTRGGDIFYPPSWVRVEVRDPANPLQRQPEGVPGVLAIIDLANIYSISAILTEDLGEQVGDGFRVTGRLTGSQLRGCNMLLNDLH
jgi:hypothetical protein